MKGIIDKNKKATGMKECERHEELFSSSPLQCFSVICDWQKAHSMKFIDFNSLFVILFPLF